MEEKVRAKVVILMYGGCIDGVAAVPDKLFKKVKSLIEKCPEPRWEDDNWDPYEAKKLYEKAHDEIEKLTGLYQNVEFVITDADPWP